MSKDSSSFELLHESVQKWIWRQGWTSLRDIQENSIPVVMRRDSDVIISASTAGGKTEATFLPILSKILAEPASGYDVLYVSPLKALINDQYRRLLDMTAGTRVAVTPWHGDVSASVKARSLKNPSGILVITPESLESFLINRSQSVKSAFGNLRYVVIDELHAFMGNERGRQLQSLLSRIELLTGNKAPRIAMSATFSDYEKVKSYLRQDQSFPCVIPSQGGSSHQTKILIKEYIPKDNRDIPDEIAKEIFTKLRGSNNLVFTNSRVAAETYAVLLGDMCEQENVPNEFRVHHGSLSKMERESVEHELQKGETPVTALCTSTLELGVDIGKVKSIAQVGVANSVSGLRQRLGRSGRRNEPSILRVFSIEHGDDADVMHGLRANLVQNIAVIESLRAKEYEHPLVNKSHLSTLVQQILSLIASHSGFYPKEGWEILCDRGAFGNISSEGFLKVLKSLGDRGVLSQLNTGQIVIGKEGERLLRKPDFYTAFVSPVDYDVMNSADSKRIGTVQSLPEPGKQIILAGKRWIVERVDQNLKNIYVKRIKTGGTVSFVSDVPEVDELIARKMKEIYLSQDVYPYLDAASESDKELIKAREYFMGNKLNLQFFAGQTLFTWAGAKTNRTIALLCKLFMQKELDYNHLTVTGISPGDVATILAGSKPRPEELAALVSRESKQRQKYDGLLTDELLNYEYANTYLDVDKAWEQLQAVADHGYAGYEDDSRAERTEGQEIFDFRHIRDINNVYKYDTMNQPLNKSFHMYISNGLPDCEVHVGTIFPEAPSHAMPINFLLRKGDKTVAVLLVHRSKVKRYSVQETEALCQENGVKVLRFYFEMDNDQAYVVERLKQALA